ncbi:hypothetical protein J6590_058987 [Homalodisca vitripennis]|nr:hypothetical protein J6590_058987 [Homalodisca vitripennis]
MLGTGKLICWIDIIDLLGEVDFLGSRDTNSSESRVQISRRQPQIIGREEYGQVDQGSAN